MASRYTDGHVVEDHVSDLLILIGYFRDMHEMCWGNSITVHSQIYFAELHVDYGSLSRLIRYCIVNGAPG